jgi:hypothetical protein
MFIINDGDKETGEMKEVSDGDSERPEGLHKRVLQHERLYVLSSKSNKQRSHSMRSSGQKTSSVPDSMSAFQDGLEQERRQVRLLTELSMTPLTAVSRVFYQFFAKEITADSR